MARPCLVCAGVLSLAACTRGWHSNIFCTLLFVLGQDESQGSNIKIADVYFLSVELASELDRK